MYRQGKQEKNTSEFVLRETNAEAVRQGYLEVFRCTRFNCFILRERRRQNPTTSSVGGQSFLRKLRLQDSPLFVSLISVFVYFISVFF